MIKPRCREAILLVQGHAARREWLKDSNPRHGLGSGAVINTVNITFNTGVMQNPRAADF